MVRFFFTADLHGSEAVFNKLLDVAKLYNVKYIIVGGDLTGNFFVPIVKEGDIYTLPGTVFVPIVNESLFEKRRRVKENEIEEVKQELRNEGKYYRIISESEYEELAANGKNTKKLFLEEAIGSLGAFIEKARAKLKPLGAKLYLMAGNDDFEEVAEFLEKNESESVVSIDRKIVEIEDYDFLGYGYSNPTPWHTPREQDEETIYKELKRLAEETRRDSIFVLHAPPINTKIDKALKLDKKLKQEISIHVGSSSVRKIIEEYAPVASFHGHIHEAQGIDYIKAKNGSFVPVLNPGSNYSSGKLSGIIAEVQRHRLEKYDFVLDQQDSSSKISKKINKLKI